MQETEAARRGRKNKRGVHPRLLPHILLIFLANILE